MTWAGAWPSHLLASSRARLVELQTEVDALEADVGIGVEQAMARFLVVRACGHVEFSFEEAFSSYAEAKSIPSVGGFVRSQFFRGSNPSPRRLSDVLRRLDPSRADRLDQLLDADDQRVRREVGLLVARRNKIAHGQSETVRRRQALDLADVALELSDWLVSELDPRS